MGLTVSAVWWYGVKIDSSELQDKIYNITFGREEGGYGPEWNLGKINGHYKYLTLQQTTYYEYDEPVGIGTDIFRVRWGDVFSAEDINVVLTPEVKEATDKLLDELEIPGERKIYMHVLMS